MAQPVMNWIENEICEHTSVSSLSDYLSLEQQIVFDKVYGQMLTRHFYLTEHQFTLFDHFEGWVTTYNRHRYKVIVSYHSSCSCKTFQKIYVCKHFLFVLKRIFNVDLYSYEIRRSIMRDHYFTAEELEDIFHGQLRRLCPISTPRTDIQPKDKSTLTLRRQSIDHDDVCPICFERLLVKGKQLVTCFSSCGKSMHKHCMNEWKRVKGKQTTCPLCQAPWRKPTASEKAVLDHYARRAHPQDDVYQKYIFCCLYTRPHWC